MPESTASTIVVTSDDPKKKKKDDQTDDVNKDKKEGPSKMTDGEKEGEELV